MKPVVSDYTKCVIDASGLGAIGGLFTGAFSTLIEKRLWKEAAMCTIKFVGKNAFKGGVVGLAAFLSVSTICVLRRGVDRG